MRRIFSHSDLRILSAALAVSLLIASAPLTAGVIVVAGPSHPELTVDVCHPMQAFDLAPSILLARPAAAMIESALCDLGVASDDAAAPLIELRFAPDTPPPKLSA